MSAPIPNYRPLLMLDTNAVHYARLYLVFADRQTPKLPPFDVAISDVPAAIDASLPTSNNMRDSLKKGYRLIERLRIRSDAGDAIQYSPVAQAELVSGRLRGEAILDAATENIPHRLWNRFDEREILACLEWNTYQRIQAETDDMDSLFQSAGIDVNLADPSTMTQVWSVARRVLGCLYLELGDCAVYASALLAEADELLSGDNYFRELVGWVQNPGSAPSSMVAHFTRSNTYLKDIVAEATNTHVSKIHLPKAPKW